GNSPEIASNTRNRNRTAAAAAPDDPIVDRDDNKNPRAAKADEEDLGEPGDQHASEGPIDTDIDNSVGEPHADELGDGMRTLGHPSREVTPNTKVTLDNDKVQRRIVVAAKRARYLLKQKLKRIEAENASLEEDLLKLSSSGYKRTRSDSESYGPYAKRSIKSPPDFKGKS
ncbi:hypothetical protein LTR17_023741, partial [Elasticomyces elasticus]